MFAGAVQPAVCGYVGRESPGPSRAASSVGPADARSAEPRPVRPATAVRNRASSLIRAPDSRCPATDSSSRPTLPRSRALRSDLSLAYSRVVAGSRSEAEARRLTLGRWTASGRRLRSRL
jgi:hypothetical protein